MQSNKGLGEEEEDLLHSQSVSAANAHLRSTSFPFLYGPFSTTTKVWRSPCDLVEALCPKWIPLRPKFKPLCLFSCFFNSANLSGFWEEPEDRPSIRNRKQTLWILPTVLLPEPFMIPSIEPKGRFPWAQDFKPVLMCTSCSWHP